MKYLFTLLITIIITIASFCQVPQKMSYQAIIRNSNGVLVQNSKVGIRISILQGSVTGTIVYTETKSPTTNTNGLISIEIGGESGFDAIEWSDNTYFLKTETDPSGGTDYTVVGINQLLSVPYAMHSKTAQTTDYNNMTNKPDLSAYLTGETDPVFNTSPAHGLTNTDLTNWNMAYSWGNHASAGYMGTSHAANGITPAMINNWNAAFAWGDHAAAGYLKVNESSSIPAVSAINVTEVKYTSARVDCNVTGTGGEIVLSRGICLSTSPAPSLNNRVVMSGNGDGTYSVTVEDLEPNTTYYIRPFATNIIGTSYGDELSFITTALKLPVLTTRAIYNISHTTAMGGGNVTDNGGSALLEKGICWSLNPLPSISDNKDPQGTDPGTYNSLMTSLTANTSYYVRAYATNSRGTSYGDELSFSTLTLSLASVTTSAVSVISYTSASSGGNVTADNGSPVTSRGICWYTSPLPTTANYVFTQPAGLGTFTAGLSGLSPSTTYYVRAFAVNIAGTVYGNEYSFTTLTQTVPVLTTRIISGISSYIAGSGGNITSDGGSAVTAKGVCWGLNPAPGLSNSFTTDGTGSASYNSTLSGLTPTTMYYVRAYATNGIGTTYGNELSFSSSDLITPGPAVPVVATANSALTGTSTASGGGYVNSDGGSEVTSRGVCWGIAVNPTLSNSYTNEGTGLGYFTSMITGLTGCGTQYYIRAYAINSTGTGYGVQNSVNTGFVPAANTDEITNITFYTATAGGTIPDDGGCPITQKGVCWSMTSNPTISKPHTSDGTGSGSFVSNITGLYANKTYYVKAYATNSKGTVYGAEKVFTTATPSIPYIGGNYAGGIIFYLDGTGEHGLVCAPSDQGSFAWGCQGTSITTGTALGSGLTNTAAILAYCSESNIAAKICNDLVLNGYSDWFLPSKDELNLIFLNIIPQGIGSFTTSTGYWSSSEWNSVSGYMQYMDTGNIGGPGKSSTAYRVRAIRTF